MFNLITTPEGNNNRVVAVPSKNGEIAIAFYNKHCYDNSHSNLIAEELYDTEIDYDKASQYSIDYDAEDDCAEHYGYCCAFYALLYANSMQPELVVYGSSSDYPTKYINDKGIEAYVEAFSEYCSAKGWRLIWLINK